MIFKKILYTINHDKQDTSVSSLYADNWQQMLVQVEASQDRVRFIQFKKLIFSRLIAENLLVLLLQYIGFSLSVFSPVSLMAGTACAFIFLRGISVLPGIGLGTFLAYYFANAGIGIALNCTVIMTLQTYFLLKTSYYLRHPTLIFYNRTMLLKFLLSSSLVTAIASFLLEISSHSILPPYHPIQLWMQGWLANLNGIFIVACALVTLDAYFPQIDMLKQQQVLKLGLMYGLLFILIFALLFSQSAVLTICLVLSLFLLTLMIGAYLGWCGVMAALFLVGMMLSLAAYLQTSIWTTYFSFETLMFLEKMLLLQTIISLLVAMDSDAS